jgi:hypothetical protein
MRNINGGRVRWLTLSRGIRLCRTAVAALGVTALLAVIAGAGAGAAAAHPTQAAPGRTAEVAFSYSELNALACPSTKQCTALTPTGRQVTFNPRHAGKVISTKLFSGTVDETFALDCATVHLCVAADSTGVVVGFNPKHAQGKPKYTTTLQGASYQTSVACPTRALCVLDSYQAEGHLNPAKGSSLVSNTFAANQNAVNATATCISTKFCVGSNGNNGFIYTFNPRSPASAKTITFTSTPAVGQIVCPTSTQCTALAAYHDGLGLGMMTFNPHKPGTKPKVHGVSSSTMGDIACASKTYCIGGGPDYGVYVYDTKTHKHKFAALNYSGTQIVAALACPSKSVCVAVFGDGKKAVFNPAKPPKKLKVEALSKAA